MPKPKKKGEKKDKKKRSFFPFSVLILIPLILILLGILYINLNGENGEASSSSPPPASFGQVGPVRTAAPPRINGGRVVLTPSPLLSESDVTARVEGGAVEGGEFQWERNGVIIPFASSWTLSKNQYKKGDRIRATFLATGGKGEIRSEEVRVENTPPKIIHAVIKPIHPTRQNVLSVKLDAVDADGDSVTYRYRWYKENGTTLGTDSSISASLFSMKERVNVEVIPSDGEMEGEGVVATETITISSPKITSIPVPFSGEEYLYQVMAESPDGEPLTFALGKSPSGMAIDSKTGLIKWRFSERDAGWHRVEIRVSNPEGGEGTQSFDLPLAFSATPAFSPSGEEKRVEN